MISNLLRGILSIENQTVLKAQSGITNSKEQTRATQNHPEPPKITKNFPELENNYRQSPKITQNNPELP